MATLQERDYFLIVRDSVRELSESVRAASESGFVTVGPLISDQPAAKQIQVMRSAIQPQEAR